jgi:lipoprotein-releasing system ATP-binding protein
MGENALIETSGVTKSFRTQAGELQVLRGIDLRIAPGEMVAIVGASGVGKSTLLHILGTLDRPTSGLVRYDGEDVFSLGEGALTAFRNRTIGFVFQFHHLLPEFSAVENVMIPALIHRTLPPDEARARAARLLESLGLAGRMDHRPGELSGGEQQRVAVARALVMGPRAVFADEPTGNLDTATGSELFGILESLNASSGTTFVIVTHNAELSSRCNRVIEMRDGRIAAS